MTEDKTASTPLPRPEIFQGYVINENGEEIPITEEMLAESFAKIKLASIGTHTGYTKAITDDMLPGRNDR